MISQISNNRSVANIKFNNQTQKKGTWLIPFKIEKRREGDSNPRTGFAGYTLSRRASSATRAPLLCVSGCKITTFILHWQEKDRIFISRKHQLRHAKQPHYLPTNRLLFYWQTARRGKMRKTVDSVTSHICSSLTPYASANLLIICWMNAGSLRWPRRGTGAI